MCLKNGNGFTDEGKNKDEVNYLIGQIMLPKSYGGILIDRGDNSIFRKRIISPIGYKKVEMEWGDFNKTLYHFCHKRRSGGEL